MVNGALRIERRNQVVAVENQGAPHNRMTFEHMDEIERALLAIRADQGVRAVVITPSGTSTSASAWT